MSVLNCDPQALITAAAPYQKIRGENLDNEVIIYLLNQILGTGLTPEQLITEARCMSCIPTGMQAEVQTFLLCQIVNK